MVFHRRWFVMRPNRSGRKISNAYTSRGIFEFHHRGFLHDGGYDSIP